MVSAFKAIFSPDEPEGPNEELLRAQRAQDAKIAAREKEEERKLKAKRAVLKAQQGGSIATLFARTGELGVKETLGS
jgi:hypothetical protein|tara:strand:+ start:2840 stop:3070 length:231 start_codon:yes stop_codon:yes gene_type:complete